MEKSIDRELLVRYMQGKCDAAETELVKYFLLQPEWQQAMDELLEEDFQQFETWIPDINQSIEWNRRFHEKHVNRASRSLKGMHWVGYAAACLILISAGFYFISFSGQSAKNNAITAMLERVNARGQRSKIILSDGSVVYLGAESSIKFPGKFGAYSREISLNGEAFFEITKNPSKPFIIHTRDVQTKVLGTSFKINAFNGSRLTVSVATGKVSIDRKISDKGPLKSLALLIPGQKVDYDPATLTAKVGETDIEAVKNWKDGIMSFVATPLKDIAVELERSYNVNIDFKDDMIKNYRISLILKNTDPLIHILEIISNTTHLHYKITGNHIIIAKKGGK